MNTSASATLPSILTPRISAHCSRIENPTRRWELEYATCFYEDLCRKKELLILEIELKKAEQERLRLEIELKRAEVERTNRGVAQKEAYVAELLRGDGNVE